MSTVISVKSEKKNKMEQTKIIATPHTHTWKKGKIYECFFHDTIYYDTIIDWECVCV